MLLKNIFKRYSFALTTFNDHISERAYRIYDIFFSDSFDRAKRLSDFLGMLVRIVFVSVIVGFINSNLSSDEPFKSSGYVVIMIILSLCGLYLTLLSGSIINDFLSNLSYRLSLKWDSGWPRIVAKVFALIVFVATVLTGANLGTALGDLGKFQAERLMERSQQDNELRMPPPPKFY